jgi:phosphate uptake regulator
LPSSQGLREYPAFAAPTGCRVVVLATQMVRGAMDAFVNTYGSACRIIAMDNAVDRYNCDIINGSKPPRRPGRSLFPPSLLLRDAAHRRIADHATNIAEDDLSRQGDMSGTNTTWFKRPT